MPFSKTSFLDHLRWLRHAAHDAGAELLLPGDSLAVLLRKGAWHARLLPRFLATVRGARLLTSQLDDFTDGFAGWLPYPAMRWPCAADRRRFREVAVAADLPVPEAFTEATPEVKDVVVKRAACSAEHPVSLPVRAAADRPIDPSQGEYFERFVLGDRLEVWYWNGQPICGEMQRPPFVIGDGTSTLAELILHRASFSGPRTEEAGRTLLARADGFLRYFGLDLASVPARGARQVVDFRRHSGLEHPSDREVLDLRTAEGGAWLALLRRAGEAMTAAAPEETRRGTLFSIDAVIDSGSRMWLLGVSSNPVVHPLVYPAMLRDLTPRAGEHAATVVDASSAAMPAQ